MSKYKTKSKKARLGSAMKRNRRLPVFVIAKTKRRVTSNPRRNWRTNKLKIRDWIKN